MRFFLNSILVLIALGFVGVAEALMPLSPITYSYSEECPADKHFFDGGHDGFAIHLPPSLKKCSLLPDGTEDGECFEKNKKAIEDYYDKHCFSCDYDKSMLIRKGYETYFERCPNRVNIAGYSVLKQNCPLDKPMQTVDGMCISCDEVNGELIDCSACPNTMVSWNGGCYLCSTNTTVFIKEECQKCSETRFFDGEYCIPKKSPDKKHPFVIPKDICCDMSDEEAHFVVYEDCDIFDVIKTDRETCDLCPNRVFTGNYCVLKDAPLGMACDRLKSAFVPKEVCDLCPNRKYVDEKCVLKEEPEGMYADVRGNYHPCYENREREDVSKEECLKCPQRKHTRHYRSPMSGVCSLVKKCPKGQMQRYDGLCISCEEDGEVYPLFEKDQSCSNREMKEITLWENKYLVSVLKECPEERPLRNEEGDCYSCDSLTARANKDDCQKCGRIYEQENCLSEGKVLLEVNGFLVGEYSCDERKALKTTPENCALCPNRKYVDGLCVWIKKSPKTSVSDPIKLISGKIIQNSDKRVKLPVCGTVFSRRACLLYLQNNSGRDKLVEDFFKEASQKMQRSEFSIRSDNPLYAKMVIPPGRFAEIIVPAVK